MLGSQETARQSTSLSEIDEKLGVQRNFNESQYQDLRQQTATSINIMSDIEKLTTRNASSHEKTQTTLTEIRSRLSSLPETTTSQFGTLNSCLETIRQQIATLSTATNQEPTQSSTKFTQRREIFGSLQRLSSLSNEQAGEIHSAEAQGVLDDLETLIDHLMRDLNDKNARAHKRNHTIMSTPCPNNSEDISEERALKRIKGYLSTSQVVNLNNRSKLHKSLRVMLI
jgi:chromosome segregation ATPase